MRILHLGNFAPLGSPLGYCPNAEWISLTLEQLGHKVTRMHEADRTPYQVVSHLQTHNYDLILVEEGRLKNDFLNDEKLQKDIIRGYFNIVKKNTDTPIVSWLTNIFFGIMRRQKQVYQNPIFKSDIVFSTDGGHDKEFKEAGVNHILLRQGIFQDEAFLAEPDYDTKAEIGFIGGMYENIWPYRIELVDWLKATYGDRFEHFGLRGEIRHKPLNRLCATLKLVVGDSVWSPNYWSNRVYEIIGRGGVLIMPKIPGLEKEFTPYKHYIPYNMGNFKQLKEIIDYYLEHDEEREAIRIAGFEYCKKHHTYKHRVEKMIKILEDNKIIGG